MDDEEDRFPAKRILDVNDKRQLYKVDWEGVDPDTGRAWSPTWEPFDFVSEVLVTEWKAKQLKREDSDYKKAHKAALRDYDIRRDNSSDEGYVSPPAPEVSHWEVGRQANEKKLKSKKRQKSDLSNSHTSSSRDRHRGHGQKSNNKGRKTGTAAQAKRTRPSDDEDDDESHSKQYSKAASKKSRRITRDRHDDGDAEVSALATRRSASSGDRSALDPTRSAGPLKELPDSLKLRTASTSVSRITHGDRSSRLEDLFASDIILGDSLIASRPSGSNGEEHESSPRFKKCASGEVGRRPSPLRHRSDDGPRTGTSNGKALPSFKKVSSVPHDSIPDIAVHQRRASAPKDKQDWALLGSVTNTLTEAPLVDANTTIAVVPDSQSQNDSSLSSGLSQSKNVNKSNNQKQLRQTAYVSYEPGSRLAQANTEKPRMPIRVPEASVFAPHLSHTQLTEDIQQFSSQAQHIESDSETSEEQVRQQLTPASVSRAVSAQPDHDNVDLFQDPQESQLLSETAADDFQTAPSPPAAPDREHREDRHMSTEAEKTLDDLILEESARSILPLQTLSPEAEDHDLTESTAEDQQLENEPILPSENIEADVGAPETEEEIAKLPSDEISANLGVRLYGPAEVQEVSTDAKLARQKIRGSTLLDREDNRQELNLFLESPEYYLTRLDRMFMQQESWDFELETEADDNTKSAWHIVLDMTQPSWKLERRVQQALKQDAGDGAEGLLTLCNALQAEVAALKKINVQQLLRLGQLESDLTYVRKQDQSKARDLEDSFKRCQRIEAENKVLQQQVTVGVQQVNNFWAAKETRLLEDLGQTKAQLRHSQEMLRQANLEDLLSKAGRLQELEARDKERKAREIAQKRLLEAQSAQYAAFVHSVNNRLTPERPAGLRAEDAGAGTPSSKLANSSEDEDYVAGSAANSSASSSESSDSGQSSDPSSDGSSDSSGGNEGLLASASLQVPPTVSMVDVQTTSARIPGVIENDALTGGLASISPAPTGVTIDGVLLPPTVVSEDTSGETTEVTTNTSTTGRSFLPGGKRESQQTDSAGLRFVDSEDILELDSAILESQFGYPCSWLVKEDKLCRKLFSSQKELFDHIAEEHVG